MSDTPLNLPVALTGEEILHTVVTIGNLVTAINPKAAGAAATATGAIMLLEMLAARLRALGSKHLSVVEQAVLKARSDANRLEVGAPASPGE